MKYVKGDLLEGDWDVAMHCANPHQVMGSGVALYLKNKWPEVYEADQDYDINPQLKLGGFTRADLKDGRSVYNLYGQVGVGNDGSPLGRNCRYDYLHDAIYRSCEDLSKFSDAHFRIGVPYKMASDRAGGSWIIVDAILAEIEEQFNVTFVVYELEEQPMKSQSSVFIKQDEH